MQKKLIAAAVATMISGAAMAQVTIYGRVDVGYSQVTEDKTTAGVTTTKETSSTGANNALTTSRLGFNIAEDLGGGMKAMGNLELGIAQDAKLGADTGNDTGTATGTPAVAATTQPFVTRLANVGLATSIGTVTIGRQTVLVDNTWGIGAAGGQNNTIGSAYGDGIKYNNSRSSELVTYNSPSFLGGLTVNLQSGAGKTETGSVADQKTEMGLSVAYVNGPLALGLGYSKEELTAAGITQNEPEQMVLAGSFDLKVAKIYATYAAGEDSLTAATTDGHERDVIEVGVRVPLGQATLLASVYQGEQDNTNAATADSDLEGFQLGAMYAFSKRTAAYLLYGANENAVTGGTTTEKQQLAFGIRHDF